MDNLFNKEFWKAAMNRALKTFCQTMIASIGTTAVLNQVDWNTVISTSLLASFLSILTSLGGLPEVEREVKEAKKVELPEVDNTDIKKEEITEKDTEPQSDNDKFVRTIYKLIKEECINRGYNQCVSIAITAQAILESGYGKSVLSSKYHNYFGMKCGSYWKGKSVSMSTKEEYEVGTLTTIKDNFRVYDSMEEGVKGYFDFINTKRYSNLKEATSYKEYIMLIKADGYATSSKYVDNVTKIADKVAEFIGE